MYAVVNAKTRLVLATAEAAEDARKLAIEFAVETQASTTIVDTSRKVVVTARPAKTSQPADGEWEVTRKYGKARIECLFVGGHDVAIACLKAHPGATLRRCQGKYVQGQRPLKTVLYSK